MRRFLFVLQNRKHSEKVLLYLSVPEKIPRPSDDKSRCNFGNTFAWQQNTYRTSARSIIRSRFWNKETAFPLLKPHQNTDIRIHFEFTWSRPCVQALRSHVSCCRAMRQCIYHRLDKQKLSRLLLLSKKLRSLPWKVNCLQHHNSRRNGNKAHSIVCSKGGGNESYHRIRTISSSNTSSILNKWRPCFRCPFSGREKAWCNVIGLSRGQWNLICLISIALSVSRLVETC